ncbi:MAG TPA: HNH endonuclease signature motif containing protein [Nocardioides sp.]|nr:HNH endonuclease signature motif containing protein [Nocardioides sp.]
MEATTATRVGELDAPGQVLAFARQQRAVADRAEAQLLQAAVAWADQHPAESLEACEVYRAPGYWGGFGDSAVPIAGPGAPLVAEFSVAEFAAAVGMTTDAGKTYLGQAVELRYRLPRLWRRVVAGELAGWKARRVAAETISHALTVDAAAHVDRHVAPVAHKIGGRAIDRLVEEAIARHMPETAEATRRASADGRHLTIDHHQISFAGTSTVHGELDLADALDLDAALTHHAVVLKDLGCTEPLDVRRALAVGELARHQPTLDLVPQDPGPVVEEVAGGSVVEQVAGGSVVEEVAGGSVVEEGALAPVSKPPSQPRRPVRQVVLYVHLHQSALEGAGGAGEGGVGRVENTRSPVTAEQIRAWCGHRDAAVTVKPVLDLTDHVHTDAYEIPDRIAEPVALRDHSCVFPWCTRPARRCHPHDQHRADCDHVVPYARGGPTCTCNLAPLCRRHHRLKTHGGWTYTTLEPGTYLWSSPHRYQYLRDHTGTQDITHDRHRHPPPPDD